MTLVVDPAAAATIGDGRIERRTLLVVLHGRGADERDLLPLIEALDLGDTVAVALRGPVPLGPGYEWRDDGGLGAAEDGLDPAAEAVLAWLDDLGSDGPGAARVRLLGFSQGAAVAAQLLRHRPERFDAAVLLSGFVQSAPHPGDVVLATVRPPVFWGHGDADLVIPQTAIDSTTDWLEHHTALVARSYPALGHGIAPEEVRDIDRFLTGELRAA